jgi:hypothetical protein
MTYVKALFDLDNFADRAVKTREPVVKTDSSTGLIQKPFDLKVPDFESLDVPFSYDYLNLKALEERIQEARDIDFADEGTGPSTVSESETVRPKSKPSSWSQPVQGNLEDLSAARESLAAIESRGSGDYAAIGPVVKKGMYKGQRAYGRYQVMEGNIPSWTREALGKSLTTEQFLNDQKAQDAVVEYQLKKSFNRYGNYEDAASIWFTGKPVSKAGNVSDGFTTAPEYLQKFRRHFNSFKGSN